MKASSSLNSSTTMGFLGAGCSLERGGSGMETGRFCFEDRWNGDKGRAGSQSGLKRRFGMQPRAHHSLKGKDSRPPAPKPRDTHIVWNGEFMGGGLGRGIQTCSETERGAQVRAGAAGGCSTPSAARLRLPARAPSTGEGTAGGEVTPEPAAPQPCLPAPLSALGLSPLRPLPVGILHQGGTIPEQGLAPRGSSRALASTPAPAFKGQPSPPPGHPCVLGRCWEAAHSPHRAELVCLGRFQHFSTFLPFPSSLPARGSSGAVAGGHSR